MDNFGVVGNCGLGLKINRSWRNNFTSAEVAEIEERTGIIRADVRDDVNVFQVWAVIYKPSHVLPDPSSTEEMVQEKLPTVQLLDLDGDGVYSAQYEGFDERGTYRLVVYAIDGEGIEGKPLAIETQIGSHLLYLPLIRR